MSNREQLADVGATLDEYARLSFYAYTVWEPFFPRMIQGGLDWDDIVCALGVSRTDTFPEDWDGWHARWMTLGERYRTVAEQAERDGFTETVGDAYQRAAACFHFAEFKLGQGGAAKIEARRRVTEMFDKALPYMNLPIEKLAIPHGKWRMPAYFIGAKSFGLTPVVILVNGLDTAKEVELMSFARHFRARDMSVFLFDGPGQGLLAGTDPETGNFDQAVARVLDYLESRHDVSIERVGIFGVGHGGDLAAWAAAEYEYQLQACVKFSGGFDRDAQERVDITAQDESHQGFNAASNAGAPRKLMIRIGSGDEPPGEQSLPRGHGSRGAVHGDNEGAGTVNGPVFRSRLVALEKRRRACAQRVSDSIRDCADWMHRRLYEKDGHGCNDRFGPSEPGHEAL